MKNNIKLFNDLFNKCSSWNELKKHIDKLDKKNKGNIFEQFVLFFLKISPKYATKLKHVWHISKVPSNIRIQLNLPIQDEGIDFVAQTQEGEFWAIQCKYKENETKSLSRKELSTFTDLTYGICRGFSLALVCTTSNRFSHKLKYYGTKISFCSGDVWRNLDKVFFTSLHEYLKNKDFIPQPLIPREYQKKAICNSYNHFVKNKNCRGKLIMPCGTGKSLMAFWIAEKLKANSIVIVVPSLHLIRQTLEVWTKESLANKLKINWLCVCSDETVSKAKNDDKLATLIQDLGIKVYTDPTEIKNWLQRQDEGINVIFSTYQSGKILSLAAKQTNQVFDLGIFDEAHKTVGRKNSLFSHLLFDENIKIKNRIFMTATERRFCGNSDEIVSMDNLQLYGDPFEVLSFKSALEYKPPILSDYQIVTMNVYRSEIAKLIDKNLFVRPDKGNWNEDIEAHMLAAAIAFRKMIDEKQIKHAISFHNTIERAEAFKEMQDNLTSQFPEFKQLFTYHIKGLTPTAIREEKIDNFISTKPSLITNARCLTEGIDIPQIDCVLFADPRNSKIDIIQTVGRALRPYKGKKYGYVIVPVIIDNIAASDQQKVNAYDEIFTILRALAANDDRIIEYFQTISQGRKLDRKGSPIKMEIPLGLKISAEDFINSIEMRYWSRLAKLSWRSFIEARTFIRKLKLRNMPEWHKYCKSSKKPADIPTNPNVIYKKKDWVSYGDWLGTGYIACRNRKYLPFKEARDFVRGLNLRNSAEWRKYSKSSKKPVDIPTNPNVVYKNKGWIDMGDWLGTGYVACKNRNYRPFEKAWTFVRKLKLRNQPEWYKYSKSSKKPVDIPANPNVVYKNKGWINIGDWLGTGYVAGRDRQYWDFKRARTFVRKLKLCNRTEWNEYCKSSKKPVDIPRHPHVVYKDKGWISMGDWLGTGYIACKNRTYRPFKKARAFVHKLGLKTGKEWGYYCKGNMPNKGKKPADIPADPNAVYKNKGWKEMGDWLGTGRTRRKRPFKEARSFARSLQLKSQTEWQLFSSGRLKGKGKRPNDIPGAPDRYYKEFKNWPDWLGTKNVATKDRVYRSFHKARKWARSLNITTHLWRKFCRGELPEKGTLPKDIPSNPNLVYAKRGWKGWADWFGTDFVRTNKLSYLEARNIVRKLGLKSNKEWRKYCRGEYPDKGKRPPNIPSNPDGFYKGKGWINWDHWLGKI